MATRALIGMIETDAAGNQVLTSTYNHYDGYPDSLGVALNRHYDEPQSAKRISNQGYISFLDPDSGAIDAKNMIKLMCLLFIHFKDNKMLVYLTIY